MKYKRFEVWLADLNPRFGTEAGKTRPVLIIQTDLLNKVHPSTIICPITSKVIEGVSILRVNVKKRICGLKMDSSIMMDQIRAIDNKRLIKKLGELPKGLQKRVIENLGVVLEIN